MLGKIKNDSSKASAIKQSKWRGWGSAHFSVRVSMTAARTFCLQVPALHRRNHMSCRREDVLESVYSKGDKLTEFRKTS